MQQSLSWMEAGVYGESTNLAQEVVEEESRTGIDFANLLSKQHIWEFFFITFLLKG